LSCLRDRTINPTSLLSRFQHAYAHSGKCHTRRATGIALRIELPLRRALTLGAGEPIHHCQREARQHVAAVKRPLLVHDGKDIEDRLALRSSIHTRLAPAAKYSRSFRCISRRVLLGLVDNCY